MRAIASSLRGEPVPPDVGKPAIEISAISSVGFVLTKRRPLRIYLSRPVGVHANSMQLSSMRSALAVFCIFDCQRAHLVNAMLAPVSLLGRGGSPVFLSFSSPKRGGWRAEEARAPDSSQGGPVWAGPDRRALALLTRAPRLSARHRGIFRFRVLRRPDRPGARITPGRLPGGRPGT